MNKMCKYCTGFETLIESNTIEYGYNIFGNIGLWDEPMEMDNSVVLEIRNNAGYIRLGDRNDMNCIDHENKIEINFCPMCGRKFNTD